MLTPIFINDIDNQDREIFENVIKILPERQGRIAFAIDRGLVAEGILGACYSSKIISIIGIDNNQIKKIHKTILDWDCLIAIPIEQIEKLRRFPSFFSYLIGHELGHSLLCIDDFNSHLFSLLIYQFINNIEGNEFKASDLPSEIAFDCFGKYIAETLLGVDKFKWELEKIIEDKVFGNGELERIIAELPSKKQLSDVKKGLIEFAFPYKDKLVELWKEDARMNTVLRRRDTTNLIDDFECLFVM